MIRRPIDPRFETPVLTRRKISTIREKPWPVDRPIQLYAWTGKAYRSPQRDIAQIQVRSVQPIQITHHVGGAMSYDYGYLPNFAWQCEGFNSSAEMDTWFRSVVPEGTTQIRALMLFDLLS